MRDIRTVGMVLHPQRDSVEAVSAVLAWGREVGVTVLRARRRRPALRV